MSLRCVRRPKTPHWIIRGTVRGIRVEESTGTADRARAEEICAMREAEIITQSVFGRASTATFAEACRSYLETGGRKGTGGDGRFMSPALEHFQTTQLAKIGLAEIEAFALKAYPNAKPSTRDRQGFTPVVAVLRHAAKRRLCAMPIIERPRQDKPQPRWISLPEANRLVACCAEHMRPLVVFLLYTGARTGEALWLDWRMLDLARAHVTFPRTKNGEARGVPLHPRVVAAIANLKHRTGDVFRRPDGNPYTRPDPDQDVDTSAGSRIATGFKGACRRAGLEDFHPHDCRHTWATWHYAANRDLGALQRLGGWKSVQMVMRYTHVNVDELAHTIDRLPSGGILGERENGRAESA
jgi:integrase